MGESLMRSTIFCLLLSAGLAASSACLAQAPAGTPAGSTGLCKDGTYSQSATKKGACKGHKGVKDWYAGKDAKEDKTDKADKADKAEGGAKEKHAKSKKSEKPEMAEKSEKAPASDKMDKTEKSSAKSESGMRETAAMGGGAGKVWVNTGTKVYHCQGDRWYGKTKEGEYMTESEAASKGFRADHGKSCQH